MFPIQLALATLGLTASVYAAPVAARSRMGARAFQTQCAADLVNHAQLFDGVCASVNSANSQVAALAQGACISGAAAFLGTVTSCSSPDGNAQRRGAQQERAAAAVSLDQALKCSGAVSFQSISDQLNAACFADDGNDKRDGSCLSVEQVIFSAVTAACPPPSVTGSDALDQLSTAASSGAQASRLDASLGELAGLPAAA